MNSLITIGQVNIDNAAVPTVNARDLHAFLEIQTRFNDWIASRIDEYGFIEDKDYVCFTEKSVKPQGGRPAKEYHLTLDMAKELSMVERNAKGKQARQYFIECERQVRQGQPLALSHIKQTIEATRLFSACVRVMRQIGLDKNASAISANQTTQKVAGINLLALSGNTHLVAENQTSLYYTPTELGKMLGGLSGRQVNLLLAGAGLQARVGEHWQPLGAGKDFARILDTGKRHGDGTSIVQLKWADTVLPLLEIEEAA